MKVITLRQASLGCEDFNLSTSFIFIFVAKKSVLLFGDRKVFPGLKPKS